MSVPNTTFLTRPTYLLYLDADVVKVSGEFEVGSQYHFHMEPQSVIVRPVEDLQVLTFEGTKHLRA